MEISGVLSRGRARAELLMLDAGELWRPTGFMVQDPVTDREEPELEYLFSSRAKIQAGGLQAADQQAGERTAVTIRMELHLPITAPAVEVGDVWMVTAVDALSDQQLVGRRFRVASPVFKSFATARRLQIEEVVS